MATIQWDGFALSMLLPGGDKSNRGGCVESRRTGSGQGLQLRTICHLLAKVKIFNTENTGDTQSKVHESIVCTRR